MHLFEVRNRLGLSKIDVIDVLHGDFVAFFTDFLLCNNDLILALNAILVDLRERFWEVKRWNRDHA